MIKSRRVLVITSHVFVITSRYVKMMSHGNCYIALIKMYYSQMNRSVISNIITRVPKARVMVIPDITRLMSLLIVLATDLNISNHSFYKI